MPRNWRDLTHAEIHAGGDAARRPDGKCHREYTACRALMSDGQMAAVTDRRYSGKGEKVV